MTVYFAGTEPDAFDSSPNDTTRVRTVNTAAINAFDPDYSRCGISAYQSNPIPTAVLKEWGDGITEGWVQSRLGFTNNGALISAGHPVFSVRDKDDKELFGVITKTTSAGFNAVLRYSTSDTVRVEVNPQGTLNPLPGSAASRFTTMYFKIDGTSLTLTWYLDSIPISSVTVTVAYMNGKKAKIFCWGGTGHENSSYYIYVSEMLVASEDCRGWRVATLGPNSLGTKDEWIGNYADIDEAGPYDDGDYISIDTANKVELFGLTNLSVPAQNMDVVALTFTGRGRKGLTGPQNIKAVLRTNATEVESATTFSNVYPTFNALGQKVWDVNPVTGNPWTVAEIQNLEAGFKSIT
ncbi:hypothetical protein DELTA_32 [Brevundimonas phage vB_BsubS-Delta]|nr:hypothetical protein DELTA_32 [Brevundimonas phage vB_BsubS-Delta]